MASRPTFRRARARCSTREEPCADVDLELHALSQREATAEAGGRSRGGRSVRESRVQLAGGDRNVGAFYLPRPYRGASRSRPRRNIGEVFVGR